MKKFLLITTILLVSCNKRELIGEWETKNYSLWDKGIGYLNGARLITGGTKLQLFKDSSFIKTTCGNIFKGKWYLNNDSLILNIDTMWARNALNYINKHNNNYDSIKGIYWGQKEIFLIKNNKLINYSTEKQFMKALDGTKKEVKGSSLTILK